MRKTVWLIAALVGIGLGYAACGDDSGGGGNNNQVCNNDGVCGAGENATNCPSDCHVAECSLTDGDTYDYIVNKMIIPTNRTESKQIGVDLDGDQVIDNKLGEIIGTLMGNSNDTDLNASIQEGIDNGSFILLGRLVVNSWPSDDTVAAQIFPGDTESGDATDDNLSGSGCALMSSSADQTLKLCGSIANNYLTAGPNDLQIAITFADLNLTVTLKRAQAKSEGQVTETAWNDVQVGGGISKDEIDNKLLPALVDWLNGAIVEDPSGSLASTVLDMLDGQCSTSVEGCESVTPGDGECAAWDPQNPQGDPISLTEARCNSTLATVLKPDVDSDGDGTPDLLSLGIKLSAVHVTIGDGSCN